MKIRAEFHHKGDSLRDNSIACFNQRYRNKIKDPLGDGDAIIRTYSCGPRVRNNFLGSKSEKEGIIKAAIVIQKFIRRYLANIRVEKIKARM
jgi:hypothetical protein